MLSKEEVIKIFSDSGALMKGHFKLTSGRHSNYYMQCAQVLQYPHYTEELARDIADFFSARTEWNWWSVPQWVALLFPMK